MDCDQIKQGITEFLTKSRLPILEPDYPGSDTGVSTAFRSNGLRLGVQMRFSPGKKVLGLIVYFQDRISTEDNKHTFQILNDFYARMSLCHFAFLPEGCGITLRSGYVLADGKFDKRKFQEHFNQIVHDAVVYYPQLKKLLAEQAANA